MVLDQLVKIVGLIMMLCNVSINMPYCAFLIATRAIPDQEMPPTLSYHLFLLLFLVTGYASLQPISDKLLKWILLLLHLFVTGIIWMLFVEVVKAQ